MIYHKAIIYNIMSFDISYHVIDVITYDMSYDISCHICYDIW